MRAKTFIGKHVFLLYCNSQIKSLVFLLIKPCPQNIYSRENRVLHRLNIKMKTVIDLKNLFFTFLAGRVSHFKNKIVARNRKKICTK